MFGKMTGKQLAGWGYGLFWTGLLVELINAFFGARSPHATDTPTFWFGIALAFSLVVTGVSMLNTIRHRPWERL